MLVSTHSCCECKLGDAGPARGVTLCLQTPSCYTHVRAHTATDCATPAHSANMASRLGPACMAAMHMTRHCPEDSRSTDCCTAACAANTTSSCRAGCSFMRRSSTSRHALPPAEVDTLGWVSKQLWMCVPRRLGQCAVNVSPSLGADLGQWWGGGTSGPRPAGGTWGSAPPTAGAASSSPGLGSRTCGTARTQPYHLPKHGLDDGISESHPLTFLCSKLRIPRAVVQLPQASPSTCLDQVMAPALLLMGTAARWVSLVDTAERDQAACQEKWLDAGLRGFRT